MTEKVDPWLAAALQRLAAGQATPEDLSFLRQELAAGRISLAASSTSENSLIVYGDQAFLIPLRTLAEILPQGYRLPAPSTVKESLPEEVIPAASAAGQIPALPPPGELPPVGPLPPGSHLPYLPDPFFTGRHSDLLHLAITLVYAQRAKISTPDRGTPAGLVITQDLRPASRARLRFRTTLAWSILGPEPTAAWLIDRRRPALTAAVKPPWRKSSVTDTGASSPVSTGCRRIRTWKVRSPLAGAGWTFSPGRKRSPIRC